MRKNITIRFNLTKPAHARAWDRLKTQCAMKEQSYSESVIEALDVDPGKVDDKHMLDMELLKQCTERIADEVERILQRTIPAFYAGIAANAGVGTPTREGTAAAVPMELTADENDGIPDEEIPWDYLGQ